MSAERNFLQLPDVIVHAFNRGVGRGEIFHCKRDYERFMELLLEALRTIPVSPLVHTLMPNHFHLILLQHEPFGVAVLLRRVCQAYSRWLNARSGRRGTNFEGRYGGVPVYDADGFLRLSYYVHMNPVAAGLAPSPDRWPYSSCRRYLECPNESLDDHPLLLRLAGGADAYARFLNQYDSGDPDSVNQFLCPDSALIWAAKSNDWRASS